MASVKINCPNHIIANSIAILCENGKIQELINEHLKYNEIKSKPLDVSCTPDFDDSDDPDHEVELEFE